MSSLAWYKSYEDGHMKTYLSTLSSKEKFQVCLFFMRQISSCIVDDYPISDDKSNHDFLHHHFNKTKVKNLRASIRRNIKFLTHLLKKETTDLEKLVKFKKEMAFWHKTLIQIHMYRFTQHTENEWNNLGISLHYLFDAFQHLYNRIILLTNRSPTAKCLWCKKSLSRSFDEIIGEIITQHLPTSYLLFSLAQDQYLGDDEHSKDRIKIHFDNLKKLVEISLKNAIITT